MVSTYEHPNSIRKREDAQTTPDGRFFIVCYPKGTTKLHSSSTHTVEADTAREAYETIRDLYSHPSGLQRAELYVSREVYEAGRHPLMVRGAPPC